jgi:hypothetical protein
MIVDKKQFEDLIQQAGGLINYETMGFATLEAGLNPIDKGQIGNLFIMSSGIFFDIKSGRKYFISLEDINGSTIENGKLLITTGINGENIMIFRADSNENHLGRIQNLLAKSTGDSAVTIANIEKKEQSENMKADNQTKSIKSSVVTLDEIEKKEINEKIKVANQAFANAKNNTPPISWIEQKQQHQIDRIMQLKLTMCHIVQNVKAHN